jgi:hypothetical protein
MAPWIVGAIVVGVVTTFAVVGVAVFVILKRRAAPKVPGQTSSEARPQAPAAPAQSQYGLLPVAIKPHVYNDGRIDLDSDSASASADQTEQAPNSEYTTVLPNASELYRV